MINTMFLQIFLRRNPAVDQIRAQAEFLDAQAQKFTSMADVANAKREADYAVYAYNQAVDMMDTADELRRVSRKYILDIINTQTGETLLHCDGTDYAHFVALCEKHSRPFGKQSVPVEANIVSDGKLVYSIVSK